jgi:hypothetical protein
MVQLVICGSFVVNQSTMTPNQIDFNDGRTFWFRGVADLEFFNVDSFKKSVGFQQCFRGFSFL